MKVYPNFACWNHMILSHLLKKIRIIRIFKLQRQRLNVLEIQIGDNVGYVNQWKARLKVYVVWTQMKFLMIILKVIISFISFIITFTTEAATRSVLWKKGFFKMLQNSQENTCARVSFLIKLQAKKETLAQVFSCEFCNIFKNTFFTEHLRTAASVTTILVVVYLKQFLSEQYTQMMIL